MHGYVAEAAESVCLIAAFFIGTGEFKRLLGKGARRFQMTGVQMRFAQGGDPMRLEVHPSYRDRLRDRLLQQGQRISDSPVQDIR